MSNTMTGPVAAWDIWAVGGLGPEAIAARQHARLRALVAFARDHSPLYRELYRNLSEPFESLAHLPQVTKTQLMGRFDDWVTDPAVTRVSVQEFVKDPALIGEDYLGRYAVWKTSGTTGNPGIFLHDQEALSIYDALLAVRGWPRFVAGPGGVLEFLARGGRMACIAATESHYAGISSWKRMARIYPWLAASMHIFSVLTPLRELVEKLNPLHIVELVAYPSVLTLLAREQNAGRLHLEPTTILAGGECLDPGERELIETTFGCRVHDVYACSEFDYIGFDCVHRWLHVNADWAILEPVDSSYRPLPPGVPSHTCLLTNLANRVQPIIRYDLGDSLTIRPDPCPCGSPLPAMRVEGRRNEILHFRADDGTTVPVLPMAIVSLLEEIPGMRRFQVVQTDVRTIAVRFEAEADHRRNAVWTATKQCLQAYLARQGLHRIRVERSVEAPKVDPISGKFRQIWSVCAP